MKKTPQLLTVGLMFAFALAGCAGNAGTNPLGAASGAARNGSLSPDAPPAIDGIAGQFQGTVKDSTLGKGKVHFTLSQIVSGQAGGSMELSFRQAIEVTSSVALDASNMTRIAGNAVAQLGTTPPCTLTVAAKFDRKTFTLSGSYKAFNNCSPGQTGTFSAKEQCYYVIAKPIAQDVRPRTLPKGC